MPDAGRTREPCVQRECTLRTQATTGSAGTTDIPCAMVLTAAPYSPRCTGLFSHRRFSRTSCEKLDPSVGGTGPYGLTVRADAFVGALTRAEHLLVHRIPLPTSVTIAIRPSCGGGMGGDNHIFRKNGRRIFFARRLDTLLIRRSDAPVGQKS